ncbi:MAG: hypothetical protein CL916_14915 [Deltaproteobacteria bacterium]|nr:hypothetical protein [Deltaproteobacteria bacterium]
MFLFFLISCATPFLKVKSDALVQPAPTLMTTAVINTVDNDAEVDLFDMVQSKDMDEIGFHLMTQSIQMLDQQGFQVYLDKEQAQSLSLLKGDIAEAGKSLSTVLGGVWFSKETSETVIDNNTILLDSYRNRLIGTLNTEKENEHFLFVSAKLSETEGFLVMRRVHLLIDYVILNESGIVVFRARGIGEGKQSFLFADKSRKSLSLAIENAIQSIEAQTKQEL